MDFFFNELSLHNQFDDFYQFLPALQTILQCRDTINKFGFRIYCERTITTRKVFQNSLFYDVILGQSDHNLKRKVRIWLERTGPFWDNPPGHDPADYFEYEQEPLENASLAEVVFRMATEQSKCSTLSFSPSDFEKTPLLILWHKTDSPLKIEVPNFWKLDVLQIHLKQLPSPIRSWIDLLDRAKANFQNLIFLESVARDLEGEAFSAVIADKVMFQLDLLNRLATCFDEQGRRTRTGHEIIESYFTGDRALFSDESSSNKITFERDMTFKKPNGEEFFCPFHGKISHRTFRLHFSWPIRQHEPLYIAYIGPKITKR